MSTPAGRRLARAALLGVAKYRGARSSHPPASGAKRMPVPVRTPPLGAPLAGRHPLAQTAWVYDGDGGWTVREPEASPPPEPGSCAGGCTSEH